MTKRLSSPNERPVLNFRSSHRSPSLSQAFLGLLALLAIALGGVADAVACSPELTSSTSIAFVDDQGPTDDDNRPTDQHAVCAHGHCHDAQHAIATPTRAEPMIVNSMAQTRPHEDGLTGNIPSLLKRPPRT
jgi:hypothetical protein